METILETNALTKKYKNFTALNNLNIHIKKGSIYGLIGKNGAGKTTLIRILCGLQKPTKGDYTIYGTSYHNIINIRKRMGAIIESPILISNMTAEENLILQSKDIGLPDLTDIDELLELVNLNTTNNKKVSDFSLGMKERLGIALALANNPDFLLLDEPINGLDPEGIIDIRELILKLNKEKGITILISSHYLDELSKIATDYGFIDNGTIIKEISSETLKKQMSHKITLKVSNILDFVKYFETHHYNYEVLDNTTINIYEKVSLSKFMKELVQNNLTPDEIKEQEQTLESYFLNLLGGPKND